MVAGRGLFAKADAPVQRRREKKLAAFFAEQARVKATVDLPDCGGSYAVSLSPDRQPLRSAGKDGMVRMVETETGKLVREFVP